VLSVIDEVQDPDGTLVAVLTALLAVDAFGITLVLEKLVSKYSIDIIWK
jgi:hypothetical protein